MIKEIVKDDSFLSKLSIDATIEDRFIMNDLLDTLKANVGSCVGMAANMIGYLKNIIIADDNGLYLIMNNPKIIKTFGPCIDIEEGCLCHSDLRKAQRYEKIKVAYYDYDFKIRIKTFSGFTAQIIQHEIDHTKGILI